MEQFPRLSNFFLLAVALNPVPPSCSTMRSHKHTYQHLIIFALHNIVQLQGFFATDSTMLLPFFLFLDLKKKSYIREVASTSPTDTLSVGMDRHQLAPPQLRAQCPPRPLHWLEIFPAFYPVCVSSFLFVSAIFLGLLLGKPSF